MVTVYKEIVETICRPFKFHLLFVKRILTQILVIAKLNGRKDFILRGFEVSYRSTRIRCENCARLRTKPLEWCQRRRSSVYIVTTNIIQTFFYLLTLNRQMFASVILKR